MSEQALLELPSSEHADKMIRLWALSRREPQQFLTHIQAMANEISGMVSGDTVHDMAAAEIRRYRARKSRKIAILDESGELSYKTERCLAGDFSSARASSTRNSGKSSTPVRYVRSWDYLVDRLAHITSGFAAWPPSQREALTERYLRIGETSKAVAEDLDITEVRMCRLIKKARFQCFEVMQAC